MDIEVTHVDSDTLEVLSPNSLSMVLRHASPQTVEVGGVSNAA